MSIKLKILDSLRKKYEATIAESLATAEIYLQNPVGIGEHSGIIQEIDTLLEQASSAQEKLDLIKKISG